MRKILAAIVAIMFFGVVSLNYGELYAVFYDRFSNEKQSQISEIDFELMGNSMDHSLSMQMAGLHWMKIMRHLLMWILMSKILGLVTYI